MEQTKVNIALMSWLLSFVAGYADTSTFISANRLFSAHVTGNFVVLVYSVLANPHSSIWMNLLAFPVFIIAVAGSTWIVFHSKYPGKVLKLEGILLLIVGTTAIILRTTGLENNIIIFCLALITVAAMGLQNGFGKLYPYTTYSATTIMTGNVTQITLDVMRRLMTKNSSVELARGLQRQGLVVGSFFMGCVAGGAISHFTGLSAMMLPGLIILYFWIVRKKIILN